MFMNSEKKSLVHNAEPRLFDVPNPPKVTQGARKRNIRNIIQSNKHKEEIKKKIRETQAQIDETILKRKEKKKVITKEVLELKRRLKAKNAAIRYLQKKSKKCEEKRSRALSVEQIISSVQPYLSKSEILVLSTQLKNSKRKRNEYSEDFKMLCISMCYKSPASYKFLRRRLNFPPKATLDSWTRKN